MGLLAGVAILLGDQGHAQVGTTRTVDSAGDRSGPSVDDARPAGREPGNVGWRISEREGEGKYRSAAVTYQGSVARVEGRALVPGLRSHQRNTISIDPDKLPADATVPKVDLMAVPGNRDVDQHLRARLLM